MARLIKSPWTWLAATLLAMAVLTAVGPAEKTLGVNVRVVYLHGAWVWTALAAFILAGILGLVGLAAPTLAAKRERWQRWSRAWGRTGLIFWILYLPLSMWAMQANWNGIFTAEPRFRVAVVFAISGLLLQLGVAIAEDPAWAAGANILFIGVLLWALATTPNVLHPPSPILNSDSRRIQLYFTALTGLSLLLAWQVARLWMLAEKVGERRAERARVRGLEG